MSYLLISDINPLTAMKKIVPTPGVFWSKIIYGYARHKIFLSRCQ